MPSLKRILDSYYACSGAAEWGNGQEPRDAWEASERGDWLLWIAARVGVDRKVVVRAACQCARLALVHTKDERVLKCIETSERWAEGQASSSEELQAARRNARAAAYAAAARTETLKQCAAIVREQIPFEVVWTAHERNQS